MAGKKTTSKCNECESLFYRESSEMLALCPECAHYLYGYKRCDHVMKSGRCICCYWDGSTSGYIQSIKMKESEE